MKNFKNFFKENRTLAYHNPIMGIARHPGNPPETSDLNSSQTEKSAILRPEAKSPTDLSNKKTIDAINAELHLDTSDSSFTPFAAFEQVKKTLVKYGFHIQTPNNLDDESGEEVFNIFQYGQKGPTDFGGLDPSSNFMFNKDNHSELHLYYAWVINDDKLKINQGPYYNIFAYVATPEEVEYLLTTDLDGTSIYDMDRDADNHQELKKEDLDQYTVEISLPALEKLMTVLKEHIHNQEDFQNLIESLLNIDDDKINLANSGLILEAYAEQESKEII